MSPECPTLYSYYRSSAAYRVRIVLNLKKITHKLRPIHLGGEQIRPDYLTRNPQGLVPTYETGAAALMQSLAIIEYLDETVPDPPLLPKEPIERARVRAFALVIACEVHPLNNLRVLQRLEAVGVEKDERLAWYRHWVSEGLSTCETLVQSQPTTRYCFGDAPTLADIFLVPQIYNAKRFDCPLDDYPRLMAAHKAASKLPAFQAAHPAVQPDTPQEDGG